MDYLSQWAVAKVVKHIISKDVARFIYEEICCKYGLHLDLFSDNGIVFRHELVDYNCDKFNIQHKLHHLILSPM